jgi:hypothetical protein
MLAVLGIVVGLAIAHALERMARPSMSLYRHFARRFKCPVPGDPSYAIFDRQVETTENFLKTTALSKVAREAVENSSRLGNIAKFIPFYDVGDYYDAVDVEYTLPLTKFVAQNPEFWGGPEFVQKANELARTTYRKSGLPIPAYLANASSQK